MEIRRRVGVELDEAAIEAIATVRDLLAAVSESAASGATVDPKSPLENPEEALSADQKRWLEPLPPLKGRIAARLYEVVRWGVTRLFKLDVRGAEHLPTEGPLLITPNHVSYLDALALAAALGRSQCERMFWAGYTGVVFRNAFMRYLSRLSRTVPIDPEKGVISSMAFGAAVLDRQRGLVWFPEGRRSPDGRLLPFKPGVGLLLAHRAVPVVPAFIRGTEKILPPGRAIPRPHPVTVAFGAPIESDELARRGDGDDEQDRITAALQNEVKRLGNHL